MLQLVAVMRWQRGGLNGYFEHGDCRCPISAFQETQMSGSPGALAFRDFLLVETHETTKTWTALQS